jgi:hypothetical protein
LPEGITNRADEQDLGIRAYPTGISPTQVTNWMQNPYDGKYSFIVIKSVDYTDDWSNYTSDAEDRYTLWTKNAIYYTDSAGALIPPDKMPLQGQPNPTPNNLGFIPIIHMTYSDVDDDGYSESFLVDIAEINRVIYNIDSYYDEELVMHAFAQLLKQKSKDVWTEDGMGNIDALSTERIMEYFEGTDPPSYLAPQVAALVEKRARKDELIKNIMRAANLGNLAGVDSANYQSGLAMAFAFSDTHLTAAEIATIAENTEREMWEYIHEYEIDLPGDMDVEYNKRYDIKADAELRENFKVAKQLINKSATFNVENDMQAIRRETNLDEPVYKKIEDELIEAYETSNQVDKLLVNELEAGEEREIEDEDIINNTIEGEEVEEDDNTNTL